MQPPRRPPRPDNARPVRDILNIRSETTALGAIGVAAEDNDFGAAHVDPNSTALRHASQRGAVESLTEAQQLLFYTLRRNDRLPFAAALQNAAAYPREASIESLKEALVPGYVSPDRVRREAAEVRRAARASRLAARDGGLH